MFNTEIVQSCSARSHYTKVGEMVFRELNNSLIFLVFSPVASNISSSYKKSFPFHFSITITFLNSDAANFSLKFLWLCQTYLLTLPACHIISMFFLATREIVPVVHTTLHWTGYMQCHAHAVSRTRSVTHTQSRYMVYSVVLWTITELKHVLTRSITACHPENTVLYVVLSNMLH